MEDADKISALRYLYLSDLLGSLSFGQAWRILANRGLHRLLNDLAMGQGL